MTMQSNTSVDVVGTVYPLWVIVCEDCGAVGTLWEKPGTGCKYVRHCHYCGGEHVRTERAEDYEQVQRIKAREVVDSLESTTETTSKRSRKVDKQRA
jgi:DNA replicative helicase MCM subunit Mcm2 (Cdc46/Mcm family)